ncbi:hypothetical protein BGW36DRAFT_369545 [Talaromyces proteolyticus]|uniref:Zn(2)-C6 fungal-type domain-containing protein n=1 Tax=Talaromyces proteolyticus TaxID=1131652 RepID=A0AAD4Q514_9EURO|nr:uncharacterized protein BGW36DRAFT_369545 [Talaromyces proteolyticus]KAH8703565.1 hypothetical protein BGW36DRAFT_369545 [Talaromyces proteolyticus]
MPKRSWNQVEGAATQPTTRRTSTKNANQNLRIKPGSPRSPKESKLHLRNGSFSEHQQHHPPTPSLTDAGSEPRSAKSGSLQRAPSLAHSDDNEAMMWPSITRKVKACAACRKQKIKCDMDDDSPPCKRCKERGLSCKLNKSLQTLIDEESRWRKTVGHDLTVMHSALKQTLQALSLPSLPTLLTPVPELGNSHEQEFQSIQHTLEPAPHKPTFDVSPQLHPADHDTIAQVPIDSLYELTHLRSLRGETLEEQHGSRHDDFISRGLLHIDEAERLFQFYQSQLDPYIYGLASKYKTLDSLRSSSSLLTACICAVAASHIAGNGKVYEICDQEFRRLVSNSVFERRINLDYLRALVIGSYWLSDVSWTLAGVAVRRASDIDLHKFYYRILDSTNGFAETPSSWDPSDPEASIDPVRLWYLLYICDQHLSILYTRTPMIREDDTIRGWRGYLESPHATQSDVRISSQVALMMLLSQMRELFGVDATKFVPRAFVPHINTFSHHLDKWLAHWSSKLRVNEHIGNFPSKGVLLHYHFGKLHLFSHVFRGLKSGDHIEPIPSYFKDAASTAVSHATTILELLLNDSDLRRSIIGVPHYFHTMIAFACVVLLKVVDRYREELGIDAQSTYALIQQIIELLRRNNCGRYHLVHWMAGGLENMLKSSRRNNSFLPLPWNNKNSSSNSSHALSPLEQDAVDNSLFSSVADIPEQPSFLSLDPNFDIQSGLNVDESEYVGGNNGALGSGPFLPMLDGADGGDYGLTDLSFNFV